MEYTYASFKMRLGIALVALWNLPKNDYFRHSIVYTMSIIRGPVFHELKLGLVMEPFSLHTFERLEDARCLPSWYIVYA